MGPTPLVGLSQKGVDPKDTGVEVVNTKGEDLEIGVSLT